jgi:hypothetical protein
MAELPDTIWADWMPPAASPVKHHIHDFHTLLLWIISLITVFVIGLLIYTVVRFRGRQSGAQQNDAQRQAGDRLDADPDPDPADHRRAVLQADVLHGPYRQARHDAESHRAINGIGAIPIPDQEIEEYSLYGIPQEAEDPKNEFAEIRKSPTYQRLLSTYELSSGKPGLRRAARAQERPRAGYGRRRDSRLGRCRLLPSKKTPCPVAPTRHGSISSAPASITASVPRSAASSTAICRSRSAPCRKISSTSGSR